jgi:hypothetical protein
MVNLKDIEKIIRKNFEEDFDYSVYSGNNKLVYFILSEKLKQCISPFPNLVRSESSVDGLKSEEHTCDGNHLSYEKGVESLPDRFTISKDSKIDKEKRLEIESQREGVVKWRKDDEVVEQ